MQSKPEKLYLTKPGAVPMLDQTIDIGRIPRGGWIHPQPHLFPGAVQSRSPELGRAAFGLEVRTWLAGLAMAAMVQAAHLEEDNAFETSAEAALIAREAVTYADALLSALEGMQTRPAG